MFTVFNIATRQPVQNVTARTLDIAARKAERICDGNDDLAYDDTCSHGTAFHICPLDHA